MLTDLMLLLRWPLSPCLQDAGKMQLMDKKRPRFHLIAKSRLKCLPEMLT